VIRINTIVLILQIPFAYAIILGKFGLPRLGMMGLALSYAFNIYLAKNKNKTL